MSDTLSALPMLVVSAWAFHRYYKTRIFDYNAIGWVSGVIAGMLLFSAIAGSAP